MSEQAFSRLILTLLLLLCAVLLYLDWMRQTEIEGLHMRVDSLVPPQPLRTPPAAGPAAPAEAAVANDPLPGSSPGENAGETVERTEVHPLVRAVLAAHTDTELSTMGEQQQ